MTATRLPAAERREGLVAAATRLFARGSYRGVTTAEIAREAGVSEPILYRHFDSKRDLYLACIEAVWDDLRTRWSAELDREDDPRAWLRALSRTAQASLRGRKAFVGSFWIQALAEAGEDAEIRAFLRRHLREVHDVVAGVIRRAQAAGGIAADRDPDAEAWIFLAGGLLLTFGERIGGLLGQDDLDRIAATRTRWLTGA